MLLGVEMDEGRRGSIMNRTIRIPRQTDASQESSWCSNWEKEGDDDKEKQKEHGKDEQQHQHQ